MAAPVQYGVCERVEVHSIAVLADSASENVREFVRYSYRLRTCRYIDIRDAGFTLTHLAASILENM
jgi:hypothetical protein